MAKEILWLLWNVFSCVTTVALYEFSQPDCPFTLLHLIRSYLQGFLMAVIPVSLSVLLAHVSLLKTKLRRAEQITRKLNVSQLTETNEKLELVSESGTETINVNPNDLLFIQSSDNYSTIVWHENGEVKESLIRSSLKRLEVKIPFSFIVRCHRSYIVNLGKVSSITGNANVYKLFLNKYLNPIPVARRFGKDVLGVLEEI